MARSASQETLALALRRELGRESGVIQTSVAAAALAAHPVAVLSTLLPQGPPLRF